MDNSDYEKGQMLTPELLAHLQEVSAESNLKKDHDLKPSVKAVKAKQETNIRGSKNFAADRYSALSLFQFDFTELPKLLDPIFPQVGLASLVGSSDTGKSTLLRQLALSIAFDLDNFIGYKISTRAKNVIYISTEDDPNSTSISIKKQIKGMFSDSEVNLNVLNNIKFIFDINAGAGTPDLYSQLSNDLENIGADLIVVDAFTDIFSGDLNSSTKVREFLGFFSDLAKEHQCLILFLHHTGKRTDKYTASKDNVLGSQAFEAKMRVLLELKHYPNDKSKRTLTITKGNYISSQIKKYSKVLKFDEDNLLFMEDGEVLTDTISLLTKRNPRKQEILPIVEKLHKDGKSIRSIEAQLKKNGFIIGKTTVSNYITEINKNS